MVRILSELPIEGETVHRIGGKDLCGLLALSSGALTQLKKQGLAVHLSHDSYDLEKTVQNYVVHLRSVASGSGTPEQGATLANERARLAKEQADAQALKNQKLRGDLVEAAEVERTWTDVLRQLRARLLAVPSRIRADRPDIDPSIANAFDRALRDALTEVGNAND